MTSSTRVRFRRPATTVITLAVLVLFWAAMGISQAADTTTVDDGDFSAIRAAITTANLDTGPQVVVVPVRHYVSDNAGIDIPLGAASSILIISESPSLHPLLDASKEVGVSVLQIRRNHVTVEGLEVRVNGGVGIRVYADSGNSPAHVAIRRCIINGPVIQNAISILEDVDTLDIISNLIVGVSQTGIRFSADLPGNLFKSLRLLNNTITMTGGSNTIGVWFQTGSTHDGVIRNNLFYKCQTAMKIGLNDSIGGNLDSCLTYGSTTLLSGAARFGAGWETKLQAHTGDPQLASETYIHHTVGRPIAGNSPVVDAGYATVGKDSIDLYGKARGSSPDIGAIEYDANYADTIFVDAASGDSTHRGNSRYEPLESIKRAFANMIPSSPYPLYYPAVVAVMSGDYEETNGDYAFQFRGKNAIFGGSYKGSITITSAGVTKPRLSSPEAARHKAVVHIRGKHIRLDNVIVQAAIASGQRDGILVDSSQHVTISRCLVRPMLTTKPGPQPAIRVSSLAFPTKHVRIENCLFRAGERDTVIILDAAASTASLDTIHIVHNSFDLNDGRSWHGIATSQGGFVERVTDLNIWYNIFDTPRLNAVYIDNSLGGFDNNCSVNVVYNLCSKCRPVGGNMSIANINSGIFIKDNPRFLSVNPEHTDYLKIAGDSPCSSAAGPITSPYAVAVDHSGDARPATGNLAIGAYEPGGAADTSKPDNHIQLKADAETGRSDKFNLTLSKLDYSSRDIKSIGIWWYQDQMPPINDIPIATPNRILDYLTIKNLIGTDGTVHTDSAVDPGFVGGKPYYFIANLKSDLGGWGDFNPALVAMDTAFLDNAPPPCALKLRANVVQGSFNQVQLNWSNGGELWNEGVDSLRVLYGKQVIPLSAEDPNFINTATTFRFGLVEAGQLVISGLEHSTTYHFAIFAKDGAGNWSHWCDSSAAQVPMPKPVDITGPTNGLRLTLVADSSVGGKKTKIRVSWDVNSLPSGENNQLTAKVMYSTDPYLPLPPVQPKQDTVSAYVGSVELTGLLREKWYYVFMTLLDSLENPSDTSFDSVKTKLGGSSYTEPMFDTPAETLDLSFGDDVVRVGWGMKYGPDYRVSVSFRDTAIASSANLVPLSNTLFISRQAPNILGAAYYIDLPLLPNAITNTAIALKSDSATIHKEARVYMYKEGVWNVVYGTSVLGDRAIAHVNQKGDYAAMWDNMAPDSVKFPQLMASGIPLGAELNAAVTMEEWEIANPRAYLTWQRGGYRPLKQDTLDYTPGGFVVHFDAKSVTERGIYAKLTITDGPHTVGPYDLSYPVQISAITMPRIAANAFQLFSIPANLDIVNAAAAFRGVTGGAYDPFLLRIYDFDGVAYKDGRSPYRDAIDPITQGEVYPLRTGQGYWVIAKQSHIEINLGKGKSASAGVNHNIPLLEKGWTDIGMPFLFQGDGDNGVYLGDILDISGSVVSDSCFIYSWSIEAQDFVPLFTGLGADRHHRTAVFLPWEGYSVYNASNNPQLLKIPPVSTANSAIPTGKRAKRSMPAWHLEVSGNWDGGSDAWNGAGWDRNLKSAQQWIPDPVGPGSRIRLRTYSPTQQGTPEPASYVYYRSMGEGRKWPFAMVHSGREKKVIEMTFAQSGQLPEGHVCVLWNPLLDSTVTTLSRTNAVRVSMDPGDSSYFAVLAGTKAYVTRELAAIALPASYALHPNSPNPFNPTTLIRFDVPFSPKTLHVSLDIYNMAGQHILSLARASGPGRYQRVWDGRDKRQRPVSAGVYFLRMRARAGGKDAFLASRKLVMVK